MNKPCKSELDIVAMNTARAIKASARDYVSLNLVPTDNVSIRLFLAGARQAAMDLGKKRVARSISALITEMMISDSGVPP